MQNVIKLIFSIVVTTPCQQILAVLVMTVGGGEEAFSSRNARDGEAIRGQVESKHCGGWTWVKVLHIQDKSVYLSAYIW
jgi:hypothetical protein